MIYIKEMNNRKIEDALVISDQRAERIKTVIQSAYMQAWHKDGPNVDQINAYVAPELRTAEEAFYACSVILTDVFGAMTEKNPKPRRK